MYIVKTHESSAGLYAEVTTDEDLSLLTVWSSVAKEKYGSATVLAQKIADFLNSNTITKEASSD
jgi:hypothetical protein